jgi:hypothetical protein
VVLTDLGDPQLTARTRRVLVVAMIDRIEMGVTPDEQNVPSRLVQLM